MIITACYRFQTRIFLFSDSHTNANIQKYTWVGKTSKPFAFYFFMCSVTKKLYYKVLKWIHLKVRCFKTSNSLEYQMKITKVFWSTWMEVGNILILLYSSKSLNDFLNERYIPSSNGRLKVTKLGQLRN